MVGAGTKTQPSRHAKSEATVRRKSSWKRTPRPQQSAAHPSVCTIVAYMIYHLIEKINPYHLPMNFIFIGLPEHLPPYFSTSGFWYYLQLKLTWFSEKYGWIARDHKRLTDVFHQLFFHLALASWMMSGCNHEQFRKAGKVQHLSNTGLAVQNMSDKVRTKKSMYEHYLLDDIIESWCRPCLSDPAPGSKNRFRSPSFREVEAQHANSCKWAASSTSLTQLTCFLVIAKHTRMVSRKQSILRSIWMRRLFIKLKILQRTVSSCRRCSLSMTRLSRIRTGNDQQLGLHDEEDGHFIL